MTAWLHNDRNTLTVVLIGTPGEVAFRMRVSSGWGGRLDAVERAGVAAYGRAPDALPTRSGARPSDALALGKSLRTDLIAASPMLGPPAIPDQPSA